MEPRAEAERLVGFAMTQTRRNFSAVNSLADDVQRFNFDKLPANILLVGVQVFLLVSATETQRLGERMLTIASLKSDDDLIP